MIRNIVFDMGMVLLDYQPMLPCLRHAGNPEDAKKLCAAIFDTPRWGELIDGGVMREREYAALAQESLESAYLKKLAADVLADWHLDGLYPKSGMDCVIDDLLSRGYRLYILSNVGHCFHDFAYKIPQLERFSGVVLSAEESVRKPDARIYQRLLSKYALNAEECLFIDDLRANIEGAKAVGMQGYCYEDGDIGRLKAYLAELK